jgi:hypothetical protein
MSLPIDPITAGGFAIGQPVRVDWFGTVLVGILTAVGDDGMADIDVSPAIRVHIDVDGLRHA